MNTSGISGTSGKSGSAGTSATAGTSGLSVVGPQGTGGTAGTSGADGSFLGTHGTSGSSGKDGTFLGSSGTSGRGSSGTSGVGVNGTAGTSGMNGSTPTASDRWTLINPSGFTITPTTLNSITFTDTTWLDTNTTPGPLKIGTPLKYFFDSGNTASISKYGIITGMTVDTIYIAGAPLTGDLPDIQNLYYGNPEMVLDEYFNISGSYAMVSGLTLLSDLNLFRYEWQKYSALLVRIMGVHKSDANATIQPKINATINSKKVSTDNSGDGIEMNSISYTSTDIGIDINKYNIKMGDVLELTTTQKGGIFPVGADASDLTVALTFINDVPEIIPYV
jgi:hypothetical protein